MCTSVEVNGKYTGQTQQFADLLGVDPTELVWHDSEPEMIEGGYKFCLCPIDIGKTAEKFGYDAECQDCGDWVLTKLRGCDK